LAVIFVAQGGGAVIDDDRIGVFELPDPHSCSTPQAAEARRLMRQVMESFPPSEVATELGSR
jgi:hypothetical protein